MSAEIIPLRHGGAVRTPIGHVVRTGETCFRQIEHLHAEGRLPARAVIVDASKARFQKEFIRALRDEGADVILDTKAAELSEIGKCTGAAKGAPWAATDKDQPLIPSDFEVRANFDLFGKISRVAMELGVTTVMAPTHFLRSGSDDSWFAIDRRSVTELRTVLDREGGRDIAIDYPLILPHTRILEDENRLRLIQGLSNLPIDNLVLRLSGFGSDAGPLTTKRTLIAIQDLHQLKYPILLDYIGGLVGLSAVAFGIVSGIAHGIGERERFDARDWHKMPPKRDSEEPFGVTTLVPLPSFDKSLRKKDLRTIAQVPSARRLVSCQDRECCPHGLNSMLENTRAHIARQIFGTLDLLSQVPDARRATHFIEANLREAERKARELSRLNVGDEKLDKIIKRGRKRIDSLARMYEKFSERDRPDPPALISRHAPSTIVGRRLI